MRDEAAPGTRRGDRTMSSVSTRPPAYHAEMDLERVGWAQITELIALLTEEERLAPGYYVEPDWSVRDLIAHLTAWFAEARTQLLDIATNRYVPHEFEVDARNAATLAQSGHVSWAAVWGEASMARSWMLEAWYAFRQPDETATAWIRKAGAEHYAEHVPRLRAWVGDVIRMRDRPPEERWGW